MNSTKLGTLIAALSVMAVTFATMAPLAAAQGDTYTQKNKLRSATVSFELREPGVQDDATELVSRVDIKAWYSKLAKEHFSTVEISNWACDEGALVHECERLAGESPESDLRIRLSRDKRTATIRGTYGDDVAVQLILDGRGDAYTVRTTELTKRGAEFTKVRNKSSVQPASYSGTVGATTFGESYGDLVDFRIERITVVSNEATDDIPEGL